MSGLAPAVETFTLSEEEKHYRLALSHGLLSARNFWALTSKLGSAKNIWEASLSELKIQMKAKSAEKLYAFTKKTAVDVLWDNFSKNTSPKSSPQLCFFESPAYPALLRHIYDPPYLLYWQGEHLWQSLHQAIGVIGTRRPTSYGLKHTKKTAHYLASQNQCLVSGMALGIDAAAHKHALDANGSTVAILGSGLNKPAPRTHLKLFQQLCEQGMVISEFPPDFSAQPWTFPMRNRLVSGISAALVVIEAAKKSGTLITVDCAIEQGREVFALPGPVDSPQSEGTHALIQQGAHLLSHPQDIAEVLQWQPFEDNPINIAHVNPQSTLLTNTLSPVYELLSMTPQSIEEIVEKSNRKLPEVLSILTELEINGLVEGLPGKLYRKSL